MQSLYTSIIRTVIPYLVGFVVSVLVSAGIEVDPSFSDNLSAFLTFGFGAIYYVVVRFAAKKYPKLEWLLGSPVKPQYKVRGK